MKKELTIRDLLDYVTVKEVKRAYAYHYPNYKNCCAATIKYLKSKRRTKSGYEDEQIEMSVGEWPPNEKWCKDMEQALQERYYSMATNEFSLSMRKWNKVMCIPISSETLKHNSFEEIVAHFIWEIRWYGNEEQMLKESKELNKRINTIEET